MRLTDLLMSTSQNLFLESHDKNREAKKAFPFVKTPAKKSWRVGSMRVRSPRTRPALLIASRQLEISSTHDHFSSRPQIFRSKLSSTCLLCGYQTRKVSCPEEFVAETRERGGRERGQAFLRRRRRASDAGTWMELDWTWTFADGSAC